MCLEFDYAQNLPLPKVSVSGKFYKRLMWLFVFNVDVHNTDNSYMFLVREIAHKKGANTICNYVLYLIQQLFDPAKHTKIYLFFEACGGQNRNHMIP